MLSSLVIFALMQQTMRNRREQRHRLLSALKSKSRTFKYMLAGFPQGFLSKELTVLVQRSLLDVSQQLAKIEPQEEQYLADIRQATAAMQESQRQPATDNIVTLDTPQKVKEVRAALDELGKYVARLEGRNVISKSHGQVYRNQIRQQVVQLSFDSQCLQGKQAIKSGKTKLAAHYYGLALSTLERETKLGPLKAKRDEVKETLASLKEHLNAEENSAELDEDQLEEQANLDAQWDNFNQKEQLWKKKNVYD